MAWIPAFAEMTIKSKGNRDRRRDSLGPRLRRPDRERFVAPATRHRRQTPDTGARHPRQKPVHESVARRLPVSGRTPAARHEP